MQGSSTQLHMKSAFFTNNKATNGIGGAISEEGDMCSMSLVGNTTFIGNTARGFGGAIGTTCIHADAIINQAFFVGNSATKSGGGIYAHVSYVQTAQLKWLEFILEFLLGCIDKSFLLLNIPFLFLILDFTSRALLHPLLQALSWQCVADIGSVCT